MFFYSLEYLRLFLSQRAFIEENRVNAHLLSNYFSVSMFDEEMFIEDSAIMFFHLSLLLNCILSNKEKVIAALYIGHALASKYWHQPLVSLQPLLLTQDGK